MARTASGPDWTARVWQPKSPQPPLKHGFKLFDKCKKTRIYKFFKPLPKVPCRTTKDIERASEHPFGVPLLQQSPTDGTQKEKKNEKDFLGKKSRILNITAHDHPLSRYCPLWAGGTLPPSLASRFCPQKAPRWVEVSPRL